MYSWCQLFHCILIDLRTHGILYVRSLYFTACSTAWTKIANKVPVEGSNYTNSPVLNLNVTDCQTECQTEAACIGIAHQDSWAGLDCRLLYDTTDLTDTVYNSGNNLYQITRCQEQTEGDTWFQRYITHARPAW